MPNGHPSKKKPTVGKSGQQSKRKSKAAVKKPVKPQAPGRPTSFTQAIGDRICAEVARKRALASLCDADPSLPDPSTVYRWLREYPEFCENYTRAKEDQADYLAEDVLTVSDDMTIPSDHKRIMVDARKWIAAKLRPKKYADKQQIEATVTEQSDLSQLDDNELAAVKAILLKAAERPQP